MNDRKRRKIISYIVLFVTIFGLIIIDFGRTFAWFVSASGEIITSSFNGYTNFNLDANGYYSVNNIPFTNNESNTPSLSIESGNFTITGSNIEKSGDGSSETISDNAAVKVFSGATLMLQANERGGSVTTTGIYSPGIYSVGGRITVGYIPIVTNSSNSSGIVVSNGGVITSNYSTVETFGSNSSAISNLGGIVNVNGGTFKTNEVNSPVISASSDVNIGKNGRGATLTSNKSDGILVDGNYSFTLNNSNLNVNGENYNGVNLHQSGNRDDGSSISFIASNNNMVTNKGDMFYITNTKAVIKLVNNTINSNGGNFMKIEGSSYGVSGSNGGDVILNMSQQIVSGNIIIDDISKLQMDLSNGSVFEGAINSNNSADMVSLKLSSDSKFVLTGDTYLSSLDNADSTNSNIDFNGHDLYINGEKVVVSSGNSTDGNGNNGGDNNGTSSDNDSSEVDSGNQNSNDVNQNTSGDNQDNNQNNNNIAGNNQNGNSGGSNQNSNGNSQSITNNGKQSVIDGSLSNDDNVNKSDNDTNSNVSSGNNEEQKSSDVSKSDNDIKSGNKSSSDNSKYIETVGSSDSQHSVSIRSIDDRTLVIINVIGVLLIITSIISIIKNRTLKDVENI